MSRVDIGLLYKLRAIYKRLDQLTWTVRDAQQRFPVGSPQNEEQLMKIYLSLIFDLEEVYNDLKKIREDYNESKK